ncbi:MAG TPA: TonB-dependent receptor [Longimicrobiales bacterium]|nr:TonB-dependent receptor [Longimicrobiales bacterium]
MATLSTLAITSLLAALQAPGGAVFGTVTDAGTGEPVATATVSAPELRVVAVTDARGRYRLDDVPPGLLHVEVAHLGYDGRTLHAFVPAGGSVDVHIALARRPVELEGVEVRVPAGIPGLEVATGLPAVDVHASAAWVRRDPRTPEPDAFASLTGADVSARPEAPGGLHVRGGAADQVAFLLDGFPVLSPYHAGSTFGAWDPDALSDIRLTASFPNLGASAALAGQVHARTVEPSDRLRIRGSATATQVRVAFDTPLPGGTGVLASVRQPFPGLAQGRQEPALLRGSAGDQLLVGHAPLLGGRFKALYYGNDNELHASALADGDLAAPDTPSGAPRNRFAWGSTTLGAAWRRTFGSGARLDISAWNAESDASMTWVRDPGAGALGSDTMRSSRADLGGLAALRWGPPDAPWTAGLRWNRSRTRYQAITSTTAGAPLDAATPALTLFAGHTRPLAPALALDAGMRAILSGDDPYLAPQLRARWTHGVASVQAAYARTFQFEQSLANPESVVGLVFPAHPFAAAGDDLRPVARGHQWSASATVEPLPGVTFRVSGWSRDAKGILLTAAATDGPFLAGDVSSGKASAAGVGVDAAWATARMTVSGAWALERVRHRTDTEAFVPDHAAAHRADIGLDAFLTETWSVQLAAAVVGGRRTTALLGAFEWEGCNLLEAGCEFAGSPAARAERLGGSTLPAYARLDLGVRKHWDIRLAGRSGVLGAFAYATNLLGRPNVLLYTQDPTTGAREAVEMRPRAPLTLGLDWRF